MTPRPRREVRITRPGLLRAGAFALAVAVLLLALSNPAVWRLVAGLGGPVLAGMLLAGLVTCLPARDAL